MSKRNLESFRIRDAQPAAAVASPRPRTARDHAAESRTHSLGFNRIERILEGDDAADVAEKLNALIASLEEYETAVTTKKERAAAKKAIVAVERTADLLDFLFQVKADMQATT